MKKYQPTNNDLVNLTVELLKNNTIDGIEYYLSDDNTLMMVEMQKDNKLQKIGARVIYPLNDLNDQLTYLESSLIDNIKVYILIEKIEIKAKDIVLRGDFLDG